jgi:SAM-dependent methyltransferase
VESRACIWCGAPLEDGERLPGRIRCRHCGAATTDPWPTAEELDRAYAGPYRPAAGRFSGPGDRLLRRARARLAGRLDAIAPPGPVLDVGAGEGVLLDALHAAGREATGLEREVTRPDVLDRDLAELEGKWAAVVFWHSLEHLPEPARALEQSVALLEPGGVLVIALPNAESLQCRLFGQRWFALDPPRHLVHLGSGALRQRLGELGLAVERVSYLRGGQVVFGWLDGLVSLLPGHPSLYDAIRRPAARFQPLSRGRRLLVLAAAAVLLPVALLAAAIEVALRRGGTVYVEARAAG